MTQVSKPGSSWPFCLLLLFSIICFDLYFTAIEINGHDSDKNSLPTLQMVEDVASIIKKLNEFDSLNTKTTESPQGNDSFSPKTI